MIAGVPNVVISLWNVRDNPTRELMTKFMTHVGTMPPAIALRQAMLETRKDFKGSLYWALFVVFGRP
jgi:CHAT domain-containing protein